MKKKKIIAMLLCTAMVGGMVAGCGSSGSSDEGSKSAKGDEHKLQQTKGSCEYFIGNRKRCNGCQ